MRVAGKYMCSTSPWATAVLVCLVYSSGCATIMSGTTERIRFESNPPGAQVSVNGRSYTTPVDVELPRHKNHDAEFVLPQYLPAKRQVVRDTNDWVYGNILIGGLIGLMIDSANGASSDLQPDIVRVELVPEPVAIKPESSPDGVPSSDFSAGSGRGE